MSKLDRIALGLLQPINPYAAIILGFLTSLWGIWLLFPQFSVFGTADLYTKMGEFAPEWAWGAWALVTGLFIILAIFEGMYRTLSRIMAFATWHWFTVSGMMWWGDWQNTGGLTYMFIGVYCAYVFLNVRVNTEKYTKHPLNFHHIDD